MSLTVKISIKDDKGKEAEIEIQEADNLSKLVIIQNVFSLFGIDSNVLEMTKTYQQIGKAYSSFFENVNPVESKSEEYILHKNEEVKQQLIDGLQTQVDELKEVYQTVSDQPDWIRTGIKISEDGKKRYKCRYQCPICYHKGTHYVYEDSIDTWCHSCRTKMKVLSAHPDGFPLQDTFGNFFRAGDYFDYRLN